MPQQNNYGVAEIMINNLKMRPSQAYIESEEFDKLSDAMKDFLITTVTFK